MVSDAIIQNAQAAAETPASGPPTATAPDATEARRQEIMKEADYWKEGPKTRALRDEMRRITSAPDVVAAEDQKKAADLPERLRAANANPALWDPRHKDHEAARKELLAAVADAATPEEKQAIQSAPLEEHRTVFGITPPEFLKGPLLDAYERDYHGHEHDFLVAARQHGLDNKLVGELRDYGIKMGMEADGGPVSEAQWAEFAKKFGGRLTGHQIAALRTWWRKSVEGQP
jgi:hypothetical protein